MKTAPSPRAVRLCRALIFTLELRERAPEALRTARAALFTYRTNPGRYGRAYGLVAGLESAVRHLLCDQHGCPATDAAADALRAARAA